MSGGPCACWPWTGYRNRKGYGHIWVAGRRVLAHRLAWELHVGPIPPGLEVCHTVCDNPPCCNPAHLTLKPHSGNMGEMVAKGRQARGERNGRAELTEAQVLEIHRLTASGLSQRALARRFGVGRSTVRQLLDRRSWAWLREESA